MLGLRLLELFVIVGLKLDEWFKDLLVLLWVLVPQQHRLLRLLNLHVLEIFELGIDVFLPELLEFCHLLWCNLPRSLHILLCWIINQPIDNCFVFNQWHPVLSIKVAIRLLEMSKTWLSAKQDDRVLCLCANETKQEHVF